MHKFSIPNSWRLFQTIFFHRKFPTSWYQYISWRLFKIPPFIENFQFLGTNISWWLLNQLFSSKISNLSAQIHSTVHQLLSFAGCYTLNLLLEVTKKNAGKLFIQQDFSVADCVWMFIIRINEMNKNKYNE